jgi:hypothetical protein
MPRIGTTVSPVPDGAFSGALTGADFASDARYAGGAPALAFRIRAVRRVQHP